MEIYELEEEATNLIKQLVCWQSKREEIERLTIEQHNSQMWHNIRSKILTASKFGVVCRSKSFRSLCKSILYPTYRKKENLEYGMINEINAIECFKKQENIIEIKNAGLFTDKEYCYLGASPDGLIDEDGLIEVKCPNSAKGYSYTDAVKNGRIKYIKYCKNTNKIQGLKRTHAYYYQIQGQLHITGRKYCKFIVWTNSEDKKSLCGTYRKR